MSVMHRAAALLTVLLAPGAALAADCGSLADLRWLLGSWTADGARTTFHESWIEVTPRTFEGAGLERARPDGAEKGGEVLRLLEMAGGVYYVSKVTHNELPVAFRLTACADGNYVFENAAHDFPKRLEYRREGDGRLVVRVSDGGDKGFTLDFRREAGAGYEAAVLADEDARFAAMIAAEPDQLRRWLSSDLVYTHSNARVEDREQLIATIVGGRMRYHEVRPDSRQVWFAGDGTAIVRGRGRFRVQAGDTPLDLRLSYLAIYVREDGVWKLRDWQSLREPD